MHKIASPLRYFCNKENETVKRPFYLYSLTTALWKTQPRALVNILKLPNLIPQSAILTFLDLNYQNCFFINHPLLIFKFYIYKARDW